MLANLAESPRITFNSFEIRIISTNLLIDCNRFASFGSDRLGPAEVAFGPSGRPEEDEIRPKERSSKDESRRRASLQGSLWPSPVEERECFPSLSEAPSEASYWII